ncbi:MAG: class I SAM-dependent methyltransferase [Candidatus Bathyarchaeota archaeon]|nr:MAG: class I SAM-dependent methyltransferase [Candidatus Bathyarchaeota archaeon]
MEKSRAEQVLRNIEGSRRRWYLPILGREKGRILVDVVRRFKPRRILEVGTLVGYSAILMGMELDDGAELITIEIDEDEAESARENIREARLRARIRVLVGDALELIPTVDGEIDMVFLDAAKHEYLKYLMLVEERLHAGSVVVADNVGSFHRSMGVYLDYVRNSGKYDSEHIPVGWDGIEISVKL